LSPKSEANKALQLTLIHSNATFLLEHALPHQTGTYWGQFEEISKYNVQLNYFERLWAAWYAFIGNDVLATGIMSFLMHEIVYFGRAIPWMIIDRMPYFNKYKIQNVCDNQHEKKRSGILTTPTAKDSYSC